MMVAHPKLSLMSFRGTMETRRWAKGVCESSMKMSYTECRWKRAAVSAYRQLQTTVCGGCRVEEGVGGTGRVEMVRVLYTDGRTAPKQDGGRAQPTKNPGMTECDKMDDKGGVSEGWVSLLQMPVG